MVVSFLFAVSLILCASSIEQLKSIVVLGPVGRIEKPPNPKNSMFRTESFSSPPSALKRVRLSSKRIAFIRMFNTYPLMVRRCRPAVSRILFASFWEQLISKLVRFRMATVIYKYIEICNRLFPSILSLYLSHLRLTSPAEDSVHGHARSKNGGCVHESRAPACGPVLLRCQDHSDRLGLRIPSPRKYSELELVWMPIRPTDSNSDRNESQSSNLPQR